MRAQSLGLGACGLARLWVGFGGQRDQVLWGTMRKHLAEHLSMLIQFLSFKRIRSETGLNKALKEPYWHWRITG